MKGIRSKIFYIENKHHFFDTIRPVKEGKASVSELCIASVEWFKQELKDYYSEGVPPINISEENSVIRQDFEESTSLSVSFSVKILNTFLCYFLAPKNKKINAYYQEHRKEHLISFFRQIKVHKTNNKYREDYNSFTDIIQPLIIKKFRECNLKLNKNWDWEFLIEEDLTQKLSNTDKGNPKFEQGVPKKNVLTLGEGFNDYLHKLQKEFSVIRLDVVNFEMPIENFINLPILKVNNFLKTQLNKLEKKQLYLSGSKDSQEKQFKINSKKINEIKRILEEKHDINNVIELGKDIFINASAGEGKSTLLRWLTHHYAKNTGIHVFPIFIELKYNTFNDLNKLINRTLKNYGLDESSYFGYRILLFLDGYDEFTGNKTNLINEISDFKKQNDVQIVFSGRNIPKFSNHHFDVVIYNLSPLSSSNIEIIFHKYLGNENGKLYYNFILNKGLEHHLQKPLYLTFLLSFIKRRIESNIFKVEEIAKVIVNKGKLLHNLIIDEFIKKYEGDKTDIEKERWKEQKNYEVELISYLAYKMTFELKNLEVINKEKAKNLFNEYILKNSKLSRLNPSKVINQLEKHNILCLNDGLLYFDKKELRLFFTAIYFRDTINSLNDFNRKKIFLTKQTGNEDAWNSIQTYLIGFLNPDLILDDFKINDFKRPPIFYKSLTQKFELALEFINQKNYPIKYDYINESYLISFIKLMISKREYMDYHKDEKMYMLSWRLILRLLIQRFNIPINYIPKWLEEKLNHYFFKFIYHLDIPYKIYSITNSFTKYDLKLSFSEVLKLTEDIKSSYFAIKDKRYFYDKIIRHKAASIRLTEEEETDFVYEYLFKRNSSKKYQQVFSINSLAIRLYVDKFIFNHSNKLINYLFEKTPNANKFTYKRYLQYRLDSFNHWIRVDSKELKPQSIIRMVEFIKKLFLSSNKLDISVYNRLDLKQGDEITIALSRDIIKILFDESYSTKQRQRAFFFCFEYGSEKEMNLLIDLYRQNDKKNIKFCNKALNEFLPDEKIGLGCIEYNAQLNLVSEVLVFLDNREFKSFEYYERTLEFSRKIIQNIKATNSKLNETILALLKLHKNDTLTFYILGYLAKFKVEDAIPLLINLLGNNYFRTHAYNTLSVISPSCFYKYKYDFKEIYSNIYAVLNSFKVQKYTSPLRGKLLVAIDVGDDYMLKLVREILKKHKQNIYETDLEIFEMIDVLLTDKCKKIEEYNKKTPS
ncbi:NACHT domain-containing protein [Lutibacter oricola]|nr:hypothetical protein [Lutibacter oricola]